MDKTDQHNTDAVELELDGYHHLARGDEEGTWEVVGNDPHFRCNTPSLPLKAGWYLVELEMERLSGPDMWAYFYPEYGGMELERNKVFLPLADPDARLHRGVVLFTHDVRTLRFDPAVSVCRFRLGSLSLRRIGRLSAAFRMLQGILGRRRSMITKARWLLSLAGRAAIGGAAAFAIRLYGIYALRPEGSMRVPYQTWLELYDPRTADALELARQEMAGLARQPRFSIILPVYNTSEQWLRKCIDSVRDQVYGNWELCIADDASPAPHVRKTLAELAGSDERIRVVYRASNGHISACSNSAIEISTGEWLVLLDHDDELHPLALLEVAKAINAHPEWRLIYSDEDKIDQQGRRFDPYMKPDFNYDLLLSHNCISHLGVYEAPLVRALGGFREGTEGSQDWDLALRCIERIEPNQVGHIPKVLYHWRAIEGSTALAPQEKNYAHVAGMRVIDEHLRRIGSSGHVEDIPGQRGNYRVRYGLPKPAPLVSIIIPTRDKVELLRACIESVLAKTTYSNYEILVVDNQSTEKATLDYFGTLKGDARVRVISYDEPFNYSSINNFAVGKAAGSVLCLLNNDITVISRDWLEEMVGHACRPGVGAVGAMLYYPNDTIQHAGVVVGAHGVAAHAYSGHARGHAGHMSRARLTQSLSAVTAACLVVRREAFEAVGGLDPALEVAFNDVDFCLRLGEQGYRTIWTPFAELYHHESASRGYEDSPDKMSRFNGEMIYMRQRWGRVIAHDPSYSLNHSTNDELFQLAFPPRVEQ
jgi:GT2 family glycosyltransferase